MPCDSVQRRIDHVRKLGATVYKTDMNFDDTARFAFEESKNNNWIMVQDTTFDDYVNFPIWCMQGYMTMSSEVKLELDKNNDIPTHIFIQAGAGSLAGSVAGFFGNAYKENRPILVTVEADTCGCIKETAEANDGELHKINGSLSTIMAGLSVGEVCSVGWKILDEYADAHALCSNLISAKGMRILGAPLGNDSRIISGESGSPGFGAMVEITTNSKYEEIKKKLNIDKNSIILCFNTEGDTDPENYEKIVWEGLYGEK